jgi:hypothetical protein
MRRFSIRRLMAFVLVTAVGLSAIRNANEFWAAVLTIAALACVCGAVLGAILLRGRERAWWLGFAVLGGVYLLVSLSPLRYRLGTTHLLEYVHAKVEDISIATFEISRINRNSVLFRIVTPLGEVREQTVDNSVYASTLGQDHILFSMAPPNRWRSLSPERQTSTRFSASATRSSPSWRAWWVEWSPQVSTPGGGRLTLNKIWSATASAPIRATSSRSGDR